MMRKLIENIKTRELIDKYNVADWNAAVKQGFSSFFQSEEFINENIETLRTELVNLSFIHQNHEYLELLQWTLQLYREQLVVDKDNCINFLSKNFYNTEKADATWMSLFQTSALTDDNQSLYDSIFNTFSYIDSVLEGCYKPQFQILYGFAIKSANSSFPQEGKRLDFGKMKANFPHIFQDKAKLYLADPELRLPVNQWRNIAAHKTFKIKTETEVELQYGMKEPYNIRIIHPIILEKIHLWVFRIYSTIRLANVITYIEYMKDIKPLLTTKPNIRLSTSASP